MEEEWVRKMNIFEVATELTKWIEKVEGAEGVIGSCLIRILEKSKQSLREAEEHLEKVIMHLKDAMERLEKATIKETEERKESPTIRRKEEEEHQETSAMHLKEEEEHQEKSIIHLKDAIARLQKEVMSLKETNVRLETITMRLEEAGRRQTNLLLFLNELRQHRDQANLEIPLSALHDMLSANKIYNAAERYALSTSKPQCCHTKYKVMTSSKWSENINVMEISRIGLLIIIIYFSFRISLELKRYH